MTDHTSRTADKLVVRLPYDIQRCTGVIMSSDNLRCKQRESCRRYLAFSEPLPNGLLINRASAYSTATADCKIKIEVSND